MNPSEHRTQVMDHHAAARPCRVCHVASTTEGATWMLEQLRDLRNRCGHEVSAIVSGSSGKLVDKLREQGIPNFPHDFEFGGLASLLKLPGSILRLAWQFRRRRFDVVQTHLFQSMVIGRLAAWIADVPVRLTMVAGPFHLEARTPRWIDQATCWMDSVLIGSCEYTLTLYRGLGVPDRRLALVYYGPDETRFSPTTTPPADIRGEFGWPRETPVIAMVAYFYPRLPANPWIPPAVHGVAIKGHEFLIRAAPAILAEFPQARIILVGNGWGETGASYMEEMRALVNELGLQDQVVFTGFRHDVNNILRAADVAVQASLNENLGGAIESLLMECPTVVTRVGGLVDCVRDGQTGVQVAPADAGDLARGVLELLRDRPRSRRLAEAGRRWMLEKFTLTRTVSDLDQLYRTRLGAGPRRGYRWWISFGRLVIAAPVCFCLAVRLVREHPAELRCFVSRRLLTFQNSYAIARGYSRQFAANTLYRVRSWPNQVVCRGRQMLAVALGLGRTTANAFCHASSWLNRTTCFVRQRKTILWGLTRQAAANAISHARSWLGQLGPTLRQRLAVALGYSRQWAANAACGTKVFWQQNVHRCRRLFHGRVYRADDRGHAPEPHGVSRLGINSTGDRVPSAAVPDRSEP